MLNWFGLNKPDHPMADPKEAKRLLAELPSDDALRALEDIVYWLESLNATAGFKLLRRYEIVNLLDQAAKPHQRKLNHEYLHSPRLQKSQENSVWNAEFEFWHGLGSAYLQCLDQYQAGGKGVDSFKPLLPTLCARIVRALTQQLKWMLLRYSPVDERLWGDLARVFQFAEERKLDRLEIAIYPGSHGGGSVQQEIMKMLMLSVSSADSLLPVTLEISERMVAHFARFFDLQATPTADCTYYFDLAARNPPARLIRGMELAPTMRFFGASRAYEELEKLSQQVAQGEVPAEVSLGALYKPNVVLEVQLHLSQYWTPNLPAREHERRKTLARLSVVHGFGEILGMLADGGATHSGNAESWIANNVSESGYGAVIQQVPGDWVKIGSLLGIKPEGGAHWGVGVIRRLSRDNQRQVYVGIQALAKNALPVRLHPTGVASSANDETPDGDGGLAMLLSSSPDSAGEISLLLRPGTFSTTQNFDMLVRGKQYLLLPAKLVEQGEDYDLTKYRVVTQGSAQ